MWGFTPLLKKMGHDLGFVQIVIGICSALYLATLLVDPGGSQGGLLSMFSPSLKSLFLFGASGAVPVFQEGRWWTLISAAWLHGGLLHILFNMMWVRQLAPATSTEYGIGRTVIIYTTSSITGFLMSSWGGAAFTVGASAPIFGLLGALVYAGKRGSSAVERQAWGYAIMLFIFGLMMPNVDNWAHFGGFAGGYLISQWLDPMQPERTDHLIAALVCIALTLLSILISILHGLQFV